MSAAETQAANIDLGSQTDSEDEDIFSQMDENGIIGMEKVDEYYRKYHPRLEGGLETVEEYADMMDMDKDSNRRGPILAQVSVDDESFNISELQDSDVALSSLSEEEPSINHLLYESDQEEEGILWHHEQDEQTIKTEGKKDQGTLNIQYKVVAGKREESDEGYPHLEYNEQPEETSTGMMGDSWCSILDHRDDSSVQIIRNDAEKLADRSVGNINDSKTQGEESNLSAEDCYSEDFETIYSNNMDQYGDMLELSHDSKGGDGEVMKEGEDAPPSNHLMLYFNQVKPSHLSVEGLPSEGEIVAEMIPESLSCDHVDESMVRRPLKGNPDPGYGSTRQTNKLRQPQLNKAPSNDQIKLTNHKKQLHSLGKPSILANKKSQNSWQIKSLNPQGRTINQRGSTKQLSRKITSETAIYGRGQLNYPLPDFSKVEPRVRFPKDEKVYQKPRSKSTAMTRSRTNAQLFLHSPADTVHQVLQSSKDCPPITPTPPGVKVPEEFKCPQEARELVYQLQEDYRSLLTKYAEAENTIDRLRIGAKVNLFADPPKPGHIFHGTSLNRPSKVMAFAISHPQKAELEPPAVSQSQTGAITPEGVTAILSGFNTLELPGTSAETWMSSHSDPTVEPTTGECLTWALAQQAEALQKQMDIFEEFLKTRNLASMSRVKAFEKLREDLDALERSYLQVREEYRGLQQNNTGNNSFTLGRFDPNREVEGSIFRLVMHLEDVKEQMDQVPETRDSTDLQFDERKSTNSWVCSGPTQQPPRPVPMVQPPKPAVEPPADTEQDPKHEILVPSVISHLSKVDIEVSSVSGESENGDTIPRTLKSKEIQLEESFDQLLDQYKNFEDLPLSLELDQVRQMPESPHPALNPPALGKEKEERMREAKVRASSSDLDAFSRMKPELRQPKKMQSVSTSHFKCSQQTAVDGEGMLSKIRHFRPQTISPDSNRNHLTQKRGVSHGWSATYIDGVASPEIVPCKPLLKTASVPLEERMASPETDSGFVGSESSRITPAAQTPEHHHLVSRSQSQNEKLFKFLHRDATECKQTLPYQEAAQRNVSDHCTIISHERQQRRMVAQAGCSRTSSPQQWVGSILSEFEQETCNSHTESEADGLGICARQKCHHSSLCSSPLTLHPKAQDSPSPLNIRSTREMIQALQVEVSRLRQRLEQTLTKPQGPSEESPPLATARPRRHLAHQHSPRRKLKQEDEEEEEMWRGKKSSSGQNCSKSFPHVASELEISTESEASYSMAHPFTSKQASASQTNQRPSPCRIQRPRPVKGPYTGTDYSLFGPRNSRQGYGRALSPSCGLSPAETADASTRNAAFVTSSPRRSPCPACKGSGTYNRHASERKLGLGAKAEKRPTEKHKGKKQRSSRMSEHPVIMGSVPPLYYVPHASQMYCSAPAWISPTPSHYHCQPGYKGLERSLNLAGKMSKYHRQQLDGEAFTVLDLNDSLDQAIKTAKSMKWTTLKMVTSLESDLHKAQTT
ncbi:microtubule organization protein AKNA isoform X2 [Narcine bancroftii]|uniref:microtubule organization protein AKNA isoform X2 n=1 Tax=Narcine bancroftii TaxID=1343680 RepID=UPI003831EF1F